MKRCKHGQIGCASMPKRILAMGGNGGRASCPPIRKTRAGSPRSVRSAILLRAFAPLREFLLFSEGNT